MHVALDANGSPLSVGAARRRFALLALGSMGVVFGDIGTSPL
jgi:K+ transporter